MRGKGLDEDGYIAREGDLARVPRAFAPVVDAAKTSILRAFSPDRLHSAYLYGSIPRGTAVPGVSDLDVMLALHDEPDRADRAAATRMESALDARFPQINGAGVGLVSTATLLSDIERYDLGWFVACLCTPLAGDDLAARLPRYRPTSLLARETNGDIGDHLPRWRERLGEARTEAELKLLSRHVTRRTLRAGFTLVMPRWGGWTSDLEESAAIFGRYYPARHDQMRAAAAAARTPAADRPGRGPAGSQHAHRRPRPVAGGRVRLGSRAEDAPEIGTTGGVAAHAQQNASQRERRPPIRREAAVRGAGCFTFPPAGAAR